MYVHRLLTIWHMCLTVRVCVVRRYNMRLEAQEKASAKESAAQAALEFEGQGGAWEKRTQDTLKARARSLREASQPAGLPPQTHAPGTRTTHMH